MRLRRGSTSPEDRIPRGAIVVVAIGLIATLAAALLISGKESGEAANLEWVQQAAIPSSKPVAVPGSKTAKMSLINGKIQSTGTNVAGYSLFRILSTLKIDAGAPVSKGRLLCSVHGLPNGTEIAQSGGNLRATYPRSSESGIYGQEVPEKVVIKFASHSYQLALLEVGDLPKRFTTIQGVKLEWPKYQVGTEHLKYFLPEGKPETAVELPFYTIWKSQKRPAAQIACRLEVGAGKATVKTEGSLSKLSPPINEAAEAEKLEEKEKAEGTGAEGEESESKGE